MPHPRGISMYLFELPWQMPLGPRGSTPQDGHWYPHNLETWKAFCLHMGRSLRSISWKWHDPGPNTGRIFVTVPKQPIRYSVNMAYLDSLGAGLFMTNMTKTHWRFLGWFFAAISSAILWCVNCWRFRGHSLHRRFEIAARSRLKPRALPAGTRKERVKTRMCWGE